MRQDTSGSSRQAVVIGNSAKNFNDTAIPAKLELAGAGNARDELSSLSLGFALIAAGSGIAAPAQGMSRSNIAGSWRPRQRRIRRPPSNPR
jgi:hypothetical protein